MSVCVGVPALVAYMCTQEQLRTSAMNLLSLQCAGRGW